MYAVVKRNSQIEAFKIEKITNAIRKAFVAKDKQYTEEILELLALRVTANFEHKIRNDRIDVEDIQDSVEEVLQECGYTDVAKAYILYRRQREKLA